MNEREFNVGDTVRVKDDAAEVGWLKRGQTGTITGLDAFGHKIVYVFANPNGSYAEGRYFGHELELVTPDVPEKKPSRAEVNRLLKKARKVASVYDNQDSTLDEYLRALRKFEQAVTEVMNK